ncbi:MAG TPA: Gfo/Idh/MocA family oxidoreductase [Solirubrobacteraceae bacterium]|nr:Gfo/Idh/MocA family oxidoreductase [Solirubrobacteraceae bacterium]
MPISIALLGCAHPHVRDYLAVIAAEPDLALAAAWDGDSSAVPGPIAGFAVRDVETAIARADAVVVCAPTDERPVLCARAARAGRPILVEKPVARTAAEARRLAREIDRGRTPAAAALFLRELPALGQLRGVLRAGILGRIAGIRARYAHGGALNGMLDGPSGWMRDPRRAGVGGFGDLALHLVDALAALGRLPRIDAVSLDRAAGGGDLGGSAVGRWDRIPVTLTASWAAAEAGLWLTVDGARATANLHDGVLEISDGGAGERWIGSPPHAGEALRAFAARLRARTLRQDGLAPAIAAQEILERTALTE